MCLAVISLCHFLRLGLLKHLWTVLVDGDVMIDDECDQRQHGENKKNSENDCRWICNHFLFTFMFFNAQSMQYFCNIIL